MDEQPQLVLACVGSVCLTWLGGVFQGARKCASHISSSVSKVCGGVVERLFV